MEFEGNSPHYNPEPGYWQGYPSTACNYDYKPCAEQRSPTDFTGNYVNSNEEYNYYSQPNTNQENKYYGNQGHYYNGNYRGRNTGTRRIPCRKNVELKWDFSRPNPNNANNWNVNKNNGFKRRYPTNFQRGQKWRTYVKRSFDVELNDVMYGVEDHTSEEGYVSIGRGRYVPKDRDQKKTIKEPKDKIDDSAVNELEDFTSPVASVFNSEKNKEDNIVNSSQNTVDNGGYPDNTVSLCNDSDIAIIKTVENSQTTNPKLYTTIEHFNSNGEVFERFEDKSFLEMYDSTFPRGHELENDKSAPNTESVHTAHEKPDQDKTVEVTRKRKQSNEKHTEKYKKQKLAMFSENTEIGPKNLITKNSSLVGTETQKRQPKTNVDNNSNSKKSEKKSGHKSNTKNVTSKLLEKHLEIPTQKSIDHISQNFVESTNNSNESLKCISKHNETSLLKETRKLECRRKSVSLLDHENSLLEERTRNNQSSAKKTENRQKTITNQFKKQIKRQESLNTIKVDKSKCYSQKSDLKKRSVEARKKLCKELFDTPVKTCESVAENEKKRKKKIEKIYEFIKYRKILSRNTLKMFWRCLKYLRAKTVNKHFHILKNQPYIRVDNICQTVTRPISLKEGSGGQKKNNVKELNEKFPSPGERPSKHDNICPTIKLPIALKEASVKKNDMSSQVKPAMISFELEELNEKFPSPGEGTSEHAELNFVKDGLVTVVHLDSGTKPISANTVQISTEPSSPIRTSVIATQTDPEVIDLTVDAIKVELDETLHKEPESIPRPEIHLKVKDPTSLGLFSNDQLKIIHETAIHIYRILTEYACFKMYLDSAKDNEKLKIFHRERHIKNLFEIRSALIVSLQGNVAILGNHYFYPQVAHELNKFKSINYDGHKCFEMLLKLYKMREDQYKLVQPFFKAANEVLQTDFEICSLEAANSSHANQTQLDTDLRPTAVVINNQNHLQSLCSFVHNERPLTNNSQSNSPRHLPVSTSNLLRSFSILNHQDRVYPNNNPVLPQLSGASNIPIINVRPVPPPYFPTQFFPPSSSVPLNLIQQPPSINPNNQYGQAVSQPQKEYSQAQRALNQPQQYERTLGQPQQREYENLLNQRHQRFYIQPSSQPHQREAVTYQERHPGQQSQNHIQGPHSATIPQNYNNCVNTTANIIPEIAYNYQFRSVVEANAMREPTRQQVAVRASVPKKTSTNGMKATTGNIAKKVSNKRKAVTKLNTRKQPAEAKKTNKLCSAVADSLDSYLLKTKADQIGHSVTQGQVYIDSDGRPVHESGALKNSDARFIQEYFESGFMFPKRESESEMLTVLSNVVSTTLHPANRNNSYSQTIRFDRKREIRPQRSRPEKDNKRTKR